MGRRLLWPSLWAATLVAAFAMARFTAPATHSDEVRGLAPWRAALQEREPVRRAFLISSFLQQLGPDELPAALEVLEAHRTDVASDEVHLFMLAWSRFDAPGAYAWARDRPTGWRHTLMREAIYAWGFRDGSAAARVLDGVEDASRRMQLETALLDGWLHGADPAAAGPYVALLEEPARRRRLSAVLAAEIGRDGPEAVMRWAEQVPADAPNGFKRLAFNQAAAVVARDDPRRAADWLEAHREQPYSTGAAGTIARRWVQYPEREGLFEWLRGLPPGEDRAEAVGSAYRVWLREDESAARAWLGAALPDTALDPAVAQLARRLAELEPASAVAWASRIQDEKLRRRSRIQAARAWARTDRVALLAWLETSDLDGETRQQILRRPSATGRRARVAAPAADGAVE